MARLFDKIEGHGSAKLRAAILTILTMAKIRTLKPNVTRDEAVRHFTEGAWSRGVSLIRGPVRSLAELYIPYRLFQVSIFSGGREERQLVALDAVRGVLDLYQFSSPAGDADLLTLETRNALPSGLDTGVAEKRLIEKVRRIIFTRGFFRVRDLKIEATALSGEICVPYWVAFRGADDRVRLAVLDAVRRKPEGAKVRRLIEEWLRSDRETPFASQAPESKVLS